MLKRKGLFIFLLLINLIAMTVWFIGQSTNVYRYAIVGAIFEILWLPMILTIILIPITSLYLWYKDEFQVASKFLYLLLWSIFSIVIIYILTST